MSDCHKKIEVDLKEKILCEAQSVSASDLNTHHLTLTIPANAGITKIYASIIQAEGKPLDGGQIDIRSQSGTIFLQFFSKDPQTLIGQYETTLVQPLCVGPDNATIDLYSFVSPAYLLSLTVVYCPDYCKD